MRFSENFELPCLDENDPAAVALYMQRLAEEIEADTLGLRSRLSTATRRPTAIWRNFAAGVAFNSAGFSSLQLNPTDDLVFSNYTIAGVGPRFGESQSMFPAAGIYRIGWSVNMAETGAVTADSFRWCQFFVYERIPTGSRVVAEFSRRVQAEGIAGGNFFGASGCALIGSGYQRYSMQAVLTHGNVASTMQVPAGGFTAWLTQVGSDDVIEVA